MNKISFALGLLVITNLFTSCTAIGDVFKAGVWSGIIVVVIIIAIIIFVISKLSGKK